MPHLTTDDGVALWYELDGPADAPLLVLSNSLGTALGMWEPQLTALGGRRLLRYDTRGHGRSSVPAQPYGVDRLGRDVLALLDAVGAARADFCGLSMGGMTGLWLGIHAPERLGRLALCNTAARIGPAEVWDRRIATVHASGMEPIVDGVIERWFTAPFRARDPAAVARIAAMLRTTAPAGYAAACAAVRDMDQRDAAGSVRVPTLVIAGTHDLATPAADGEWLAGRIAGARYVPLDAAHLSNIEAAADFTAALTGFLADG